MIIALQTLVFFRHSILTALDRLISPYYNRLTWKFSRHTPEEEEEDEEVYAVFDDDKGVVFYPPMYAQRYAAVSDCLMDERWCGKLEKVVDLGYHDVSFIKYLKDVPGIRCILGVDLESIPLRCSSDLLGCEEYAPLRESPLQVTLFQGNAADPDYRLIGCDAVIAIEMIEHMLPHDLDRLVHTIFGFVKPWIAIFTTPNADFNVLFKNMEKNGLRRWDHFFEWTREQYHDWCSNIVVRYPQYTVSCKGIGPGPPGTNHIGCCSQMALFVNKDYHKQQDLNLNSLALVTKVASPINLADKLGGWDSPLPISDRTLPQNEVESLTDIPYSESCMIVLRAESTYSFITREYQDKTSQCNLDSEVERNFLMFNEDDMCDSVLVPRRKLESKVYEIEDVNSRLNCTTCQVTKFSKTTQNLMAKNNIDSLIHTREVVNEIQHLKKMLNYKETLPYPDGRNTIWCNINWGENAPYWNQYYMVVREYNYPFEQHKSEESRILDLIAEEINRLIDAYSNKPAKNADKLEIPLEYLMEVVKHITDDEARVKDLLEWNGYEVVNGVVIYSRLVVDNPSTTSFDDEWPENDTESDYDTTDVRSTTVSDGSTTVPDYHGRCVRRALDKKVRALKAMMSAEEDISTELDRAVCRLMKLALFTSKGLQAPPPTKWMQSKLLDLLTLTEKAIARRRKQCVNSPLKAIEFTNEGETLLDLTKMKGESKTVRTLMAKYYDILEGENLVDYPFEFNNGLDREAASNETLKDFEFSDTNFAQTHNYDSIMFERETINDQDQLTIERTQAWISKDTLEVVSYPKHREPIVITPSDHSTSNGEIRRYKRAYKKTTTVSNIQEGLDKKTRTRPQHRTDEKVKAEDKNKKRSKTTIKTVARNKSSTNSFVRSYRKKLINTEYGNYRLKSKRKIKEHKNLQSTSSKPIPGSLIELCHPELSNQGTAKFYYTTNYRKNNRDILKSKDGDIATTEESVLKDILMDDAEETITLHRSRSIGTDASTIRQEHTDILDNYTATGAEPEPVKTENVQSQTIFLYDINEPSTSKGIRHNISMDVQCGTDTMTPSHPKPSPVSSFTGVPKIFGNGIKIEDSLTNFNINNTNTDIEAITDNNVKNFGPSSLRISSPCRFSKGIKISDSEVNVTVRQNSFDFGTCTNDDDNNRKYPCTPRIRSPTRCSGGIKIKDSYSDLKNIVNCEIYVDDTFKPSACTTKLNAVSVTSFAGDLEEKVTHFDTVTKGASRQQKYVEETVEQFKLVQFENVSIAIPTNYSTVNDVGTGDSHTKLNLKTTFEFGTQTKNNEIIRINEVETKVLKSKQLKSEVHKETINRKVKLFKAKSSESLTSSGKSGSSKNQNMIRLRSRSSILNSFGLKIKSKDGNIDKTIEYSTTRVEISDFQSPFLIPLHEPYTTESKLTDSGSEFYGSGGCSSRKSFLHLANLPVNTNHTQTLNRDVNIVEKISQAMILQPHLSCGGVHVHSFKDKYGSEDIVFQGEWQRLSPRCSPNRRSPVMKSNFKKRCSETNYDKTQHMKKIEDITQNIKKMEDITQNMKEIKDKANNMKKLKDKTQNMKKIEDKTQNMIKIGNKTQNMKRIEGITQNMKKVESNTQNMKKIKDRSQNIKKVEDKTQNIKKIKDKTQSMTKIQRRPEVNIEPKKPAQIRNRQVKLNKDTEKKTELNNKNYHQKTLVKTLTYKSDTKVSSKVALSSITAKNTRNSPGTRRTVIQPPKPNIAFGNKYETRFEKNAKEKKTLPNYLKRTLLIEKKNLNRSLGTVEANNKTKNVKTNKLPLERASTEIITKDLLKTSNDPRDNINYLVFRNELDNNQKKTSSNNESMENTSKPCSAQRKRSSRRSSSPISQTSSTCSTPDSIETVKEARSRGSTRKHSGSSNKSNIDNATDNENVPPVRNRKYNKKPKAVKKFDDKENIPETSKTYNMSNDEALKKAFIGKNKNIFLAHLAKDDALNSRHQILNKSKIPTVKSNDEKKRSDNAAIVMKKSAVEDSFNNKKNENQCILNSDSSNMVYVLGSNLEESEHPARSANDPINTVVNIVDNCLLPEWLEIDNRSEYHRENTESCILATMRQIVEDRLDFISAAPNKDQLNNSVKMLHNVVERELDENFCLKNFQTVLTNEENPVDSTTRNNTYDTAQEDSISFNSLSGQPELESVSAKYSDYFLAEDVDVFFENNTNPNDNSTDSHKTQNTTFRETQNTSPLCDTFEKEEQNPILLDGMLAAQALCGFSISAEVAAVEIARQAASRRAEFVASQQPDPVNRIDSETGSTMDTIGEPTTEPLSRDPVRASLQPDPINFVDSETGSVLRTVVKEDTSEEMFVSGRSSASYESCFIEEDVVVPSWLFTIVVTHVDPVESEDDAPLNGTLGASHVDPIYDMNGNETEAGLGVIAGAGAGDGRGMHSDHSQDSSGRGSSLSSTDTSSGPQSEFEILRDSIDSSAGVTALVTPMEPRVHEGMGENEMVSTSRDPTRTAINTHLLTSDGDADVSSLDTDVPDSSDNSLN